MTDGQIFEYEIALKIYNYDLSIIDKELTHMLKIMNTDENKSMKEYAKKRIDDLMPLKEKKEKQIKDLMIKYKKA